MMMPVVMIVLALVAVAGFVALWAWARRSEAGIDWDHPEVDEDKSNAARLGIALNSSSSNLGSR